MLSLAAVSTNVSEKGVEIGMVDADGDFARVSTIVNAHLWCSIDVMKDDSINMLACYMD